jgi:hypothetical protein
VHADASLSLNGGDLNIVRSYEGLESLVITLNGGNLHVVASDDGVNGSGGADGSSVNGRPGQNMFESGNSSLAINGGYLYVDAGGDGIDINGAITMSAGTVIVNGPTNNGNGPLDYTNGFNITGGYLVAVGSSGMAQAPSATSTQYSFLYGFDSVQAAGTMIHIQSESGEDILTLTPTRQYQSVVVSSPALKNGSTYTIYVGGSASGTSVDGLYTDGTYSGGSQVAGVSLSGMTTTAGTTGGFGPGGGGGPGGGPGMPPSQ